LIESVRPGRDGRLLVFGGPYSNLQATEALLAEAGRLAIGPRSLVCTGDLVAYCGAPQETAALLRRAGVAVVMGNTEEAVGGGQADCGCGFAADSACDLLSRQWYAYTLPRVDQETRAWMRGLPRRLTVEIGRRRLAVVHGSATSINRFLFESSSAGEKAAEIAAAGADGIIAGHSGLPFAQLLEGRLWLNAGAIGLPANDGTPRVWYGLLRETADGLEVSTHAFTYDYRAAARCMRDSGLDNGYAAALETGLWPSLDVLPAVERARRGVPLAPLRLFWRHGERAGTA